MNDDDSTVQMHSMSIIMFTLMSDITIFLYISNKESFTFNFIIDHFCTNNK